jgi:DNA-binding PadR family transcriptional regulator
VDFVELGKVCRAVKIAVGLGGEVSYWDLHKAFGGEAVYVLEKAQELRLLKWTRTERGGRTRVVYRLTKRAIEMIDSTMDRCPIDVEARGGRLLVRTPFGSYAVGYSPSALLSLAEKLAEACGEDRRETYNKLKRAAERAIRMARGLERWLLYGSTSL